MTTPDDFPATSMAELDDAAKGVALLVVAAFLVLVAAFVGIGWFIGRTRGAW